MGWLRDVAGWGSLKLSCLCDQLHGIAQKLCSDGTRLPPVAAQLPLRLLHTYLCRQRLEAELASRSASLEERQHAAALLAAQQAELQAGLVGCIDLLLLAVHMLAPGRPCAVTVADPGTFSTGCSFCRRRTRRKWSVSSRSGWHWSSASGPWRARRVPALDGSEIALQHSCNPVGETVLQHRYLMAHHLADLWHRD